MMPHPERACSEALANTDGKYILESLFINKESFALPEKQLMNF
jgi:phosphoribosylformylglycinamidine (FGAM) synthase-like amidotransferase family enzyme